MNWNRILAIARWEYLQRVRSKGFIISIILTPVLIVAFSVLPSLLMTQEPNTTKVIGVIDSTGALFDELRGELEGHMLLPNGQPRFKAVNYMPPGVAYAAAVGATDSLVLNDVLAGTLVFSGAADTPTVTYRSTNPSNIVELSKMERVVQQIIAQRRLREAGLDTALYGRINRDIDIATVKVTKEGGAKETGFMETFFAAYAGCILLMLLVLTTGQSLVRSLVEEKSNRIMEILVASSTPYELMWGKLIGLSGLGLTQMGLWGLFAFTAYNFIGITSGITSSLMNVYAVLPFIVVYLILGYIFFAAIFIGVGSLVTTEQEAQMMNSYIVMLLVAPMAFSMVVIQSPDVAYMRVLSYVPVFTPSLMMMRCVSKTPPMWEIASTMGTLVLATIVTIWAAGKVFRTAILMYGKRPTFAEVVRWVKAR